MCIIASIECALTIFMSVPYWLDVSLKCPAYTFHEKVPLVIADFKRCQHSHTDYECANNLLSIWKFGEVGYQLSSSLYSIHNAKWLTISFRKINSCFSEQRTCCLLPMQCQQKLLLNSWILSPFLKYSTESTFYEVPRAEALFLETEGWYSLLNETRTLMAEFFAPDNRALAYLTGDENFLWSN